MNANDIALTQVDRLGFLLAQIAELTKEADAIKDAIKDAATAGGDKVVEGNLFKATVVEANRKVVDWKNIQKVLNIPEDVIIDNTQHNCCVLCQNHLTLIGGQHEQNTRQPAGFAPLDRPH